MARWGETCLSPPFANGALFHFGIKRDQGFAFCEWKQDKHLNYGDSENNLSAFVKLVTEHLSGAGDKPVGTYDQQSGVQFVGTGRELARPPVPANNAATNPQTLIGAIEEYKRSSDAKRQAIEGWLAPRLAGKPEVAKVLDSIVLKFVQDRFGPAGDQALVRIAGHIKQFPSDPILRELLAQQVVSRINVGLPIADLKRDIEQQIPEWKPLSAANSDVLEKYLEWLSLMEEKRIKLELAKAVFPVSGNA
jgi:hypothetical protein